MKLIPAFLAAPFIASALNTAYVNPAYGQTTPDSFQTTTQQPVRKRGGLPPIGPFLPLIGFVAFILWPSPKESNRDVQEGLALSNNEVSASELEMIRNGNLCDPNIRDFLKWQVAILAQQRVKGAGKLYDNIERLDFATEINETQTDIVIPVLSEGFKKRIIKNIQNGVTFNEDLTPWDLTYYDR